jgi:hypothetical protein
LLLQCSHPLRLTLRIDRFRLLRPVGRRSRGQVRQDWLRREVALEGGGSEKRVVSRRSNLKSGRRGPNGRDRRISHRLTVRAVDQLLVAGRDLRESE